LLYGLLLEAVIFIITVPTTFVYSFAYG